jgi:hypothetical protein
MTFLSRRCRPATRTSRLRAVVAVIALVGAVIVVGVFATVAKPATSTYCNGCTLSYTGTPAVSPTTQYFTYNAISLFLANNWHIYLYNTSTGNQTCDASGFDTYGGHNTCANTATARCQLLQGYGVNDQATCWADY